VVGSVKHLSNLSGLTDKDSERQAPRNAAPWRPAGYDPEGNVIGVMPAKSRRRRNCHLVNS